MSDNTQPEVIPANQLVARIEAFAALLYAPPPHAVLQVAANRIKALEAENKELREALDNLELFTRTETEQTASIRNLIEKGE